MASSLFKSHVLEPIHLNQVQKDQRYGNLEKIKREKDMGSLKKKNQDKLRMRDEV